MVTVGVVPPIVKVTGTAFPFVVLFGIVTLSW
jgi:hypothetical protein